MSAPLDLTAVIALEATAHGSPLMIANVSRRRFLQGTSALGGLVLAVGLPAAVQAADAFKAVMRSKLGTTYDREGQQVPFTQAQLDAVTGTSMSIGTPPITEAVMTVSSRLGGTVDWITCSCVAKRIPAIPAKRPCKAKTPMTVRSGLSPAARAASVLPPTA